jgi:hypothetical protein
MLRQRLLKLSGTSYHLSLFQHNQLRSSLRREKRSPLREGLVAQPRRSQRLTVEAHQEVRIVDRRKAIRYERLVSIGTCLSRQARQDIAVVSWLRICIEQTEKSESSGE